ncbi:MAG: nucleoside 2-deoxyribosyltransferase [Nitrospira sp.]|nr:nucleoside 2-deoxyribosyltransferase [Nitrospira sp.]
MSVAQWGNLYSNGTRKYTLKTVSYPERLVLRMTIGSPTGFFAYPSKPPHIPETINTAVTRINRTGVVSLKTWEDCKVNGTLIIDEICKAIDGAAIFCADLTTINPNVMFELGYAIASNKRVWIILDTTFANSQHTFNQLRILTSVGFAKYCNAEDIERSFHTACPYQDLDNTIFNQTLKTNLVAETGGVLYLKARHEIEASKRISKRVENGSLPVIVDDPREISVQPLSWYASQVYRAEGVLCHFTSPNREGSEIINAKYALVAGMALGFGKSLLILQEGNSFAPMDYRDILQQYETPSQAEFFLGRWLPHLEELWCKARNTRQHQALAVKLATDLRGLHVGEYLAENEQEGLVQDYFIETASYHEALSGKSIIFVGRKGTGKTANLLKMSSLLRQDARNVVCIIKPIAYELQGIVELLRQYKERDTKGYALESLWKFLVVSEMAVSAVQEIQNRPSAIVYEHEADLMALYSRPDRLLKEDFTVRLEKCVAALMRVNHNDIATVEGRRLAIAEAIHSSILQDLRLALGKALKNKNRVSIIIDNLDKAWDKQSDLVVLSEFLLGLLGVANRIPVEFAKEQGERLRVKLSLTIFLRSDIFYKVMQSAREPDKIRYSKLVWIDKELLLKVINERLEAAHSGNLPADEIWRRYFTPTVRGQITRAYFTNRIMPRPRDIVYFVKAAVSLAVNRGHVMVEEKDILDAEKQYSEYALESILVENGITIATLEKVIYEFAGSSSLVSHEESRKCVLNAGIPQEQTDRIISHLATLAFLGVEVGENDFRFAEDFQEYQKLDVLTRRYHQTSNRPVRYKINAAFSSYLEIVEA